MARILTTASIVSCPHLARFTLTSSALLRVAGNPVIRPIDLASATVVCPSSAPCTKIIEFQTSTNLLDQLSPVVLAAGIKSDKGACTIEAAHDLMNAE
jgi:hypothetical protein